MPLDYRAVRRLYDRAVAAVAAAEERAVSGCHRLGYGGDVVCGVDRENGLDQSLDLPRGQDAVEVLPCLVSHVGVGVGGLRRPWVALRILGVARVRGARRGADGEFVRQAAEEPVAL